MKPTDQFLADCRQSVYRDRDLRAYTLYVNIERELAKLRKAGQIAARIYHDHSDEAAWDELYEALSDAGLLDEEPS